MYELRLGEEAVFAVRVAERELDATRGPAASPAATITTEPGILQEVLWHGRSRDAGGLEIDGDRRAGARFLRLFPLPD